MDQDKAGMKGRQGVWPVIRNAEECRAGKPYKQETDKMKTETTVAAVMKF